MNLTDEPIPVSGYHVVAKGETLYEIAWRYGKDFRDIAAMNHIASPFVIYPNQKLYLNAPLPQPKQRKPKVFTTIVQKNGPTNLGMASKRESDKILLIKRSLNE